MAMEQNQKKLNNYSVINTSIQLRSIKGVQYIEKTVRSNLSMPISTQELKALIDQYIVDIKTSKIPLPEVKESFIVKDSLIYICRYEGPNIIQQFTTHNLLLGDGSEALEQTIQILAKAKKKNLFIDPHPKNFVWNGERVHYVDFCPPYVKDYMEMRTGMARNEERDIVEKNFSYFGPEYLFYHFAGDFFNVNPEISEDFYRKLYQRFIASNVIKNSYFNFIDKAKKIRKLEDLRLKKGIYLF